MEPTLDQRIEQAHIDAETTEDEARAIEARIRAAGGIPPQGRRYGQPVSREAVKGNLTLSSVLAASDPALAAYLGVPSGHARALAEREAHRLREAESLRATTARLAAVNADARRLREQAALGHLNPLNGRRWGQ